ncbi:SDR family oxidoreductase [Pseudorhodoferax sp.]|uniref:SDR family oxidoreductase n=1 Tax=Pseudorhodoferax sp. TaxID=1993553 RepID=UPI002DD62861|nr:SDR family NAD(P)-dependent oxidoreductase [Pseudorhodoferax sp.]
MRAVNKPCAVGPLDGRVVAVTGAASGIGRACVDAFRSAGCQVLMLDVDGAGLEAAAHGDAARLHAFQCDIADQPALSQVLDEAQASCGPIDVLVNCAGVNGPKRHFADTSPQAWDRIVAVNLSAMFYACHLVIPGMRERGRGTIVNFASWAGRHGAFFPGVAYSASKRAVLSLTESINIEEGLNGLRATAIVPEEVATAIVDKRPVPPTPQERARMLTPDDVAQCVLFAASLPERVCINELTVSPTWNRSYLGLHRTALAT